MASLCKRQQCTIERRGFRQELDSWRHKLIHCVGFESILEGLFGPGLIKDLTLFQDCEPEGVSDWSFDENCLFCCLRREKVKEHLVGLNSQVLLSGDICKQEQSKINRLEKQAEEFLNAVFYRKDVPSFSDPHIPLVAREIMQRMIRQFAAEYTSKTSSSQDTPQPNGTKDQSLPKAPSLAVPPAAAAVAASAQNPVLSKLLMADQDSPLDLTIKKPDPETLDQDGVLDLSTKRGHNSGGVSLKNSHGCPTAPVVKGDFRNLSPEKARDLQSVSSLKQFMAKLCPHHQRQIVNALEFLQTEVGALNPPRSLKSPAGALALQETVVMDSGPMSKSRNVVDLSTAEAVLVPDISAPHACSSPTPQQVDSHISEPLKHLSPIDFMDQEGIQLNEQAKGDPGSNVLNDVKNSLVELSNSSHTLEDHQCNSKASSDQSTEPLHTACDAFDCPMESSSQGDAKDLLTNPNLVKRTSKTILPASPRTARKSCRGPHAQTKDSSIRQVINDPDINYDIVYISKPITEIELEPKKHISPRRTARKSTRGYKFVEDFLELRTVRTLARKSSSEIQRNGNCPTLVAELETVTPKQALSKPDGIPSVDVPFVGGCGETAGEGASIEKAVETKHTGDGVTEGTEVEPTVETSQTDQPRLRGLMPSCPQGDESQPSMELDPMGQVSPSRGMFSCLNEDDSQLRVTTNETGPLQPEGEKYVCSQESEVVPEENLVLDFVPDSQSKDDGSEKHKKETVILLSDQPLSVTMPAQDNSVPTSITDASESISAVAPEEDPFLIGPVTALDGRSRVTLEEDCADVEEISSCSEVRERVLHQSENEELNMLTTCLGNDTEPVAAEEQQDIETDVTSVKEDTVEKLPSEIDSALRDDVSEPKFQETIVCNIPEKSQSLKENGSKNSDRCLRSRVQLRDCESVTPPRTVKKTSSSIKGFQENDPESTTSEQSQKSSDIRTVPSDCLPTAIDKTVLESALVPINKSQSSDSKSNDCKVEDNRVQTRQNYKYVSHEEPGKNGGNESISTIDGTNLQKRETNISEEIVVATDSVKSEIPDLGNNVASEGVSLEDVPMRRESKRIAKSVNSGILNQSSQVVLRSQSSKAPGRPGEISADKTTERRHVGCSVKATVGKGLQPQKSVSDSSGIQSIKTTAENSPKFLEALREEETQQLIAKLNTRYDKMQKGWIQLDKDGQAISRPRNKADRLKDIWKSKRRSRKPKFCDGQKYSPVQMLFMKTFDLATVCHWYLQSTETRSLVIVKKVNTRLPSETQLGFYGSSGLAGNSRALFPSLQAERLKKHLKKFPVASPVKSNLKNQQLIAKTREHNGFSGKESVKTELTTATRISTKPNPQHPPSRSQAAASANLPVRSRILRKYSNIREKLQGQRQKLQPCKNTSVKTVLSPQAKIKPHPQALKKTSQDGKLKKNEDKKVKTPVTPSSKKQLARDVGHGKQAKSRSDRLLIDGKDVKMPARTAPSSRSVAKPPSSVKSKSRAEDQMAASKKANVCGVQKINPMKMSSRDPKELKKQVDRSIKEIGCVKQTKVGVAPSPSKAQVLTRSQRKMEAMPKQTAPAKPDRKRTSNVEPPPFPVKMTRKSLSKTETCPTAENGLLL
ncbi:uncharacterized protein lcor isoform X2 [Brienomyrus brachyistius]|uniref:uncharacterized protein lcor isoform X2 n=1 Tax=Brienomyrus brachyistius TaxID=42636 RepID=UPI0020B1BE6D|nr:uncharacterized protein lcor isoform X2 [Brienomyrus brachyistius]